LLVDQIRAARRVFFGAARLERKNGVDDFETAP
jgi:hypothetical protein